MTERVLRTQQSYDRIAAQFHERHGDRSPLQPWMHRFIACLPGDGVVLDLGAGPCHDSAELRALGLHVVSVDRSRQMLAVARDKFPGPRVQADLRTLPFRPRSIAGVWASASLLHLDRADLLPALRGVRDLLVPRGVIFFTLKDGLGERWETKRYGAELPRWFTYWSEPDVDAVIRAAGLRLVEAASQDGLHDRWIARIAVADEAV